MPYPGDRRRKTRITILASVITGELNYDFPLTLTHANFVDATKTLGGATAMAQGGTDLAFSLDEAGTIWLDREIVRAELSATPADSRIEILVTVPASHISDTVDSYVYAWCGSETETQPASDGLYGKYAVWNGPARDGFAPLTTWGVWHLDEDPAGPIKQYKNSAGAFGTGREMQVTNGTRFDGDPGRGVILSGTYTATDLVTTDTEGPDTGPWCLVAIGASYAGKTICSGSGGTGRSIATANPATTVRFTHGATSTDLSWGGGGSGVGFAAMSRSGDTIDLVTDAANSAVSGFLSTNFVSGVFRGATSGTGTTSPKESLLVNLRCAPNIHWLIAFKNSCFGLLLDVPEDSQPAAITAEVYFADLNAGTEVRIYEQPHGCSWSVDLAGITPADLNDAYITCQIQSSTVPVDDYFWFNYNSTGTDPNLAGTGHEIVIAVGDMIADVAATLQSVANTVTDLSATVDGTLVTVLNERDGEVAEPADGGTGAELSLIQIGGIATDEIDGIESSAGTSWTASYQILRPRKCLIAIASIRAEIIQYNAILTTAGLTVPAGALFREDYANK